MGQKLLGRCIRVANGWNPRIIGTIRTLKICDGIGNGCSGKSWKKGRCPGG